MLRDPIIKLQRVLNVVTTHAIGNRPLEPKGLEVEFFPMEEVLHEEVKVHRQPDHGCGQAC